MKYELKERTRQDRMTTRSNVNPGEKTMLTKLKRTQKVLSGGLTVRSPFMIQKVLNCLGDSRILCEFMILESQNLKVKSCTYAVNVFEDIYIFYFRILIVKTYGPSFGPLKKNSHL